MDMGLEEIGVELNHRGQIKVDGPAGRRSQYLRGWRRGRSAWPGERQLRSGSIRRHQIADGQSDWSLIEDFPTGISAIRNPSSLGRTNGNSREGRSL